MLNKQGVILIILFTITIAADKNHESNKKVLAENAKKAADSKKVLDQHSKDTAKFVKDHENIKNTIIKADLKEDKKYKEMVTKYQNLIKNYNLKRNSACARLPEFEGIKQIKSPREKMCLEWIYEGQMLGLNQANALFKISIYKYYAAWLFNNTAKGLLDTLLHGNNKNKLHRYIIEHCYKKGYLSQFTRTFQGLRENKKDLLTVHKPFMNPMEKSAEIKKVLDSINRLQA